MQNPLVAPENLPSVIKATLSPVPCPYIADVVANISLIPGPPFGPSYLITITSPSLYCLVSTALYACSSLLKTLAGPRCFNLLIPATLTIAPSGAKLPFKPTTPPVGEIGLLIGLTTF